MDHNHENLLTPEVPTLKPDTSICLRARSWYLTCALAIVPAAALAQSGVTLSTPDTTVSPCEFWLPVVATDLDTGYTSLRLKFSFNADTLTRLGAKVSGGLLPEPDSLKIISATANSFIVSYSGTIKFIGSGVLFYVGFRAYPHPFVSRQYPVSAITHVDISASPVSGGLAVFDGLTDPPLMAGGRIELTEWLPPTVVSLPDSSIRAGDQIWLPVVTTDLGCGNNSYQIVIFYPPDILRPLGVEILSGLVQQAGGDLLVAGEDSSLVVNGASVNYMTGSGPLFYVGFEALDVVGSHIVSLNLEPKGSMGYVYPEHPTQPTLVSSHLAFEGLYLGDVTHDWAISMLDASVILKSVVGLTDSTLWPYLRTNVADVTGSGQVSSYDVALILALLADQIDTFPGEPGNKPATGYTAKGVSLEAHGSTVTVLLQGEQQSANLTLSYDHELARIERVEVVDGMVEFRADHGVVRIATADAISEGSRVISVRLASALGGDMGSVSLVSLEIDENVIDISLTAPVQIRGVPSQTALFQNSPNPFNPVTTIGFTVGQNADSVPLTLTLFSTGGQEVVRLVDGPLQPGYHELLWDGRDSSGRPAASGIYLYRLTTPHGAQVRRMLLMR